MKVLILYLMLCISAIFVSCSNDDMLINKYESTELNGVCVLQERDSKLPTEPLEYPIETEECYSRSNGSGTVTTYDKLGYSYFVGNSIIGNPENIGAKVLDINRIKDFDSDLVDDNEINNYVSNRFSYTDYETYESHIYETKKITTGFKINLGLFSLGRKSTNLSTFSSDITSSQTAVYGELNMMYRYKSYSLKAEGDVDRKYFARDCQTNSFKRNLYGSPIGKLINTYGPFVLTGYVTGGKAVALFAGEGKVYDSKEKRTSAMNRDIDASFQWHDKKDSVGGNVGLGKTDSVMHGNSYDIKNLKTKLWIAGGTPIGMTLNSTIDLSKVSINLEPWVQSLDDPSKHTIIDVTQNGLYPLSEFVLEENFRKRIDNTIMGITSANNNIIVPYIEITRVFDRYSQSGVALYDVAAVLVTRQGDRIVLRTSDASLNSDYELSRNENISVFSSKAEDIKNKMGQIFKLKIESNSVSRLNPLIGNPLCIDLKKINLESMQRRPQASSGIVYIYDAENKIAFSYYEDIVNGDIVLDQYGIRDWVETIPQKSISIAAISNLYRIIGL